LIQKLMPSIKQSEQERTLLFIPSYYDFVRVRNWLTENSYLFAAIHEYSRTSEVSRSRSRFFRGQIPLLLYTGRAQYFFRYKIRGAHHLVMYQLPDAGCGENESLYSELVGFLDEAKTVRYTTICTQRY
jgi:U3 small nucleolar RNA-associated protein 25